MIRYGKLHLYGIFYIFRGSVKDEYLMKIWDIFFLISYFSEKTYFWVLIRSASSRRF